MCKNEQRVITQKLLMIKKQFLGTALPIYVNYQLLKFHDFTSHTF